jgi:hypothetical protein
VRTLSDYSMRALHADSADSHTNVFWYFIAKYVRSFAPSATIQRFAVPFASRSLGRLASSAFTALIYLNGQSTFVVAFPVCFERPLHRTESRVGLKPQGGAYAEIKTVAYALWISAASLAALALAAAPDRFAALVNTG